MRCAVIMAGGKGERFWPKSTFSKPKQFLKLIGNKSIIRLTYERLLEFLPKENIFVVVGEHLVDLILEHIPELVKENIIIEPFPRNTAPAIGLASVYIRKYFGNATTFITPSDHYIADLEQFGKCLEISFEMAEKYLSLITLGIKPSRPDTGYGYIEVGNVIERKGTIRIFETIRFVEKPNYEKAVEYINSGNFLWNSGMFTWTVSTVINEISNNIPKLRDALVDIEESLGTSREKEVLGELFENVENISIDYGVMEKSKSILCVESNFKWDDIGSWGSVYRLNEKDELGNVVKGNVVYNNVKNSLLIGDEDGVLSVSDMENVVVVKEDQKILVLPLNKDQNVREIVNIMKKQDKYIRYL